MSIKIKEIAYYLPEHIVTNQMLQQENPAWNLQDLSERTGVLKRHIAAENETALDLAFQACQKMFPNGISSEIDGIIFCTQSQDYIVPSNACVLHQKLRLSSNVFAFDLNMACSGYIYGLALARGLIMSGTLKNVLLINADTYSKYIHPKDRSVRCLFGDGAAVSWLTNSHEKGGIVDLVCSTSGENFDKFIIPAGGCRMPRSNKTSDVIIDKNQNHRSQENICMKGMDILVFVNSQIPQQIEDILRRNHLRIKDVDLFIFHQASKVGLDSLKGALQIDFQKCFENYQEIGNTVSASIPIALKDALDCHKVVTGNKVILCGFGAGLSWGTALLEF